MMRKGVVALLTALCVATVGSSKAFAEAFAMLGFSADALGRGDAAIASVDNAAAVWYNPAAMSKLDGVDLMVNFDNIWPNIDYTPKGGGNTIASDNNYFLIPSLFATWKLNDALAVGLGANSPYGLEVTYPENGPFRYISTGSTLQTININPAVSYKVNDSLSVAAGLDIVLAEAEMPSAAPNIALSALNAAAYAAFNPGALTDPTDPAVVLKAISEGKSAFTDADGTGYGFNLGFLYDIDEKQSLGLTFRSQVVATLEGKIEASFSDGTKIPDINAEATARIPDSVGVGYANKISDQLLVEADIVWRNWDDWKEITLFRTDTNAAIKTVTYNFKNAGQLRLGGKYKLSDELALSAGYVFHMSPVREYDFKPAIPDSDMHAIHVGADYKMGNLSIIPTLMYADNFKKDVNAGGTVDAVSQNPLLGAFGFPAQNVNGEWDVSVVHLALAVAYKF